jgi:hypothetical protein
MAEQEAALRAAGADLAAAYRDKLTKMQIKRRTSGSLSERAKMLGAPPSRATETIYVASLRVLGWTMADISRSLAAAGRRNASVHAVDRGRTFTGSTLDAELLDALADTEKEMRGAQSAAGRSAGVLAAAAARERRRRAKIQQALPLWSKPPGEISAAEISALVGMSVRALHYHLGSREDARAKARRSNDE